MAGGCRESAHAVSRSSSGGNEPCMPEQHLFIRPRHHYSKKRKKTVLCLGLLQAVMGLVIIGVSFSVFAMTAATRIRHASPCWAGFALLFTGGVGVISWRQPSSLSLGFYTFLSCICILLHLVATTLSGLGGVELQSIRHCFLSVKDLDSCICCTSDECTDNANLLSYAGTKNCVMLHSNALKEIMFANCITNILACILCISAAAVGFILAFKRHRRRRQFMNRSFRNNPSHLLPNSDICDRLPPLDSNNHFVPLPFPPPPYEPPQYTEISNDPVVLDAADYVDERSTANILIDPGELPPPYSTLDYKVAARTSASRGSRRHRQERILAEVFRNPHSDNQSTQSPAGVPSYSRAQNAPPPPPVRWDSWHHNRQMSPSTRNMGSNSHGDNNHHTHNANESRVPECQSLHLTENPVLPLTEPRTPLQIHLATRGYSFDGEMPSVYSASRNYANNQVEETGRQVQRHRSHSNGGSRRKSTGSHVRAETTSVAVDIPLTGRAKHRKSRRTRSLQSSSSASSRQFDSSSDSEEEMLRASRPRRKPRKSGSSSDGSSFLGSKDSRLNSTGSQCTLKSKSNSSSENSLKIPCGSQSTLCNKTIKNSSTNSISSIEERLLQLRRSFDSLTNSSVTETLVEGSTTRPDSLMLDLKDNSVKMRSPGSLSQASENSDPWILRSRSNTSEGMSFASSSLTLASEASGGSNEQNKPPLDNVDEKLPLDNRLFSVSASQVENEEKKPLPQETVPLILPHNEYDKSVFQFTLNRPQFELPPYTAYQKENLNEVVDETRPKSIAEVNHETRVVLKQLLMDIESDKESPLKSLLTEIQGMLKTDEHCLVDLQHSANVVNHILNYNETVPTNPAKNDSIKLEAQDGNEGSLLNLEHAKETVL